MTTKNIQDVVAERVEEFERKYGAFEFTCPETDTIKALQDKK